MCSALAYVCFEPIADIGTITTVQETTRMESPSPVPSPAGLVVKETISRFDQAKVIGVVFHPLLDWAKFLRHAFPLPVLQFLAHR
jgi:hypothetical protein